MDGAVQEVDLIPEECVYQAVGCFVFGILCANLQEIAIPFADAICKILSHQQEALGCVRLVCSLYGRTRVRMVGIDIVDFCLFTGAYDVGQPHVYA